MIRKSVKRFSDKIMLKTNDLPARRAENAHQQPDRDHDDSAEQEVAPQPVHGIEAEIPQPLEQETNAVDDIPGIEADRRQHDADEDREQDQAKRDRQRRAAEKAVQAVATAGRQISDVVGHLKLLGRIRPYYRARRGTWGTRNGASIGLRDFNSGKRMPRTGCSLSRLRERSARPGRCEASSRARRVRAFASWGIPPRRYPHPSPLPQAG